MESWEGDKLEMEGVKKGRLSTKNVMSLLRAECTFSGFLRGIISNNKNHNVSVLEIRNIEFI